MSTPKHKLDVFRVLRNINQRNKGFFSELTDEEIKAFHPLVVERWLTGTDDPSQIIFVNELVNRFVFSLPNDKELVYKLMTICTSGGFQKYQWTRTKSKYQSNLSATLKVIEEYFDYNQSQALGCLPLMSNEEILELADEIGCEKEVITKIKKELKTRK